MKCPVRNLHSPDGHSMSRPRYVPLNPSRREEISNGKYSASIHIAWSRHPGRRLEGHHPVLPKLGYESVKKAAGR